MIKNIYFLILNKIFYVFVSGSKFNGKQQEVIFMQICLEID